MRNIICKIGWVFCIVGAMYAQQEPQYSQYVFATQLINPAYISSKEYLSANLIYRTQWVGISGAPKTASFTVDAPMDKNKKMALGLAISHDEIGPSQQTTVTVDYGYTIQLQTDKRLAFGLKVGTSVLDIDFQKLNAFSSQDPTFQNNIDNRWQPHIGAGMFYYTSKFFSGISTPNFLETKYFVQNNNKQTVAAQRLHMYWLSGYIYDLNMNVKLKPTLLLKATMGAPLQWEVSANFMFYEKVQFGAVYRSSTTIAAIAGFQIVNSWFIGVGYDRHVGGLDNYSDGTFDLVMQFRLVNRKNCCPENRFY